MKTFEQIFVNVAIILPPGGHNLRSYDRLCYDLICILTRQAITRQTASGGR